MELEGTPNILVTLLQDMPPVSESTVRVYRQLDGAVMAAEEARLLEKFLDTAGKLVVINELRGER